MSDLGRPDDALPLLRWSLEFDNPENELKASVSPDVVSEAKIHIREMLQSCKKKLGTWHVSRFYLQQCLGLFQMEKVSAAIEKLENKEAATEFQNIKKGLADTKQISEQVSF